MSITAALVKELRERTGAGMMDCKKALQESDGDIEVAIEAMRKAGQAKADKKSGRTAAEGIIVMDIDDAGQQACLLEINCETDFVARDTHFLSFAERCASLALQGAMTEVEALLAADYEASKTVETVRTELVAKIGENINIRRLTYLHSDNGQLGAYSHGGRIGVLVVVKGGSVDLAKDLAMHIAASNPLVITQQEVPQTLIDKEKEIIAAQAAESGKPPEVREKIVAGQLSKFLDENSLLGQPFVKEPKTKISALLAKEKAEVVRFVRLAVGEGIEKKQTDFAQEVMAQVQGSD